MLTGYCLRGSRCDRCRRIADLALVTVGAAEILAVFLADDDPAQLLAGNTEDTDDEYS